MNTELGFLQNNKVELSPSEQQLLGLLRFDDQRSTEELTKLFYKQRRQSVPFNGRIIINNLVRSLMMKVNATRGAGYSVSRSARSGPKSIKVWLRKRA